MSVPLGLSEREYITRLEIELDRVQADNDRLRSGIRSAISLLSGGDYGRPDNPTDGCDAVAVDRLEDLL